MLPRPQNVTFVAQEVVCVPDLAEEKRKKRHLQQKEVKCELIILQQQLRIIINNNIQ